MKNVYRFDEWLNESKDLSDNLRGKEKLDLSKVKYAYHWVNEGNLFDQMYVHTGRGNDRNYILRKYDGKKLDMPPLPEERFYLGGTDDNSHVCLTVDAEYVSAGVSGESYFCLVFEVADLEKLGIENLTNNGEAEIRVKRIPDWDKIFKHAYVVRKNYETGDGWEGFFYRAAKEWMPEKIKSMLTVAPSAKAIGKLLLKEYPNNL